MNEVVIDASTTIAWLLEETEDVVPVSLDDVELVAPWLWRIEVANAVWTQERRQRITAKQCRRALQIVDALEVDVVPEPAHRNMEHLVLLAKTHRLTTYDAVYLELAMSLSLRLSTFDQDLQRAAQQAGVDLWTTP